MPHNFPNPPKSGRGRHEGGFGSLGGNHRKRGCCSYVEAGKAFSRRKYRLAARYIRLDVKTRLGVI